MSKNRSFRAIELLYLTNSHTNNVNKTPNRMYARTYAELEPIIGVELLRFYGFIIYQTQRIYTREV